MTTAFIIISLVILASGIAAMTLRNLVHCALSLSITFAGLAALYLQLDADFVGFAQILVYVGAIAILIVFAILLTRGAEIQAGTPSATRSWPVGIAVAALVLGGIAWPALNSPSLQHAAPPAASAPV